MASMPKKSASRKVSKPRPKPPLEICFTPVPASQNDCYVLDLLRGDEAATYWLRPLPSDFGRAYRLTKFLHQDGESYDLLLDGPRSTCECLGHLRWQTPCKHLQALLQLDAAGRLPTPPRPLYRSTAEFARCDPEGYEAMLREYPPLPGSYDEDAEEERRYAGPEEDCQE
jgi:hypothetical protein